MKDLYNLLFHSLKLDLRNHMSKALSYEMLKKNYDIILTNNDLYHESDCNLFSILYLFRRRFPSGKKAPLYPRELLKNPLFQKYRKNVNKIAAALNTGKSIREYLPEDINNLNKCRFTNSNKDHLLTEWGITHIHLFTRQERKLLQERQENDDKYILYSILTDDKIFFIDIQDHTSITNTQLLDIIHNNLTGNALSVFIGYNDNIKGSYFDKKKIKELRKLGISFFPKINEQGTSYTSGMYKLLCYHSYNQVEEQLKIIARWIIENYSYILDAIHLKYPNIKQLETLDIHMGFEKKHTKFTHVFLFTNIKKAEPIILNVQDFQPIQIINNILKQFDML